LSGIALPALSVLIYGRLTTGSKKPLNGKGGDGGPMKPPAYAVVSVLHRPVEFASKIGCSQLAALGRGRVETVLDLRACRTRGLVVVIGATESSSSLVAQTRGWFRSRVTARAAKSVKEAHAPASRIAFIVLGAPNDCLRPARGELELKSLDVPTFDWTASRTFKGCESSMRAHH
jgi:hypothetical protein